MNSEMSEVYFRMRITLRGLSVEKKLTISKDFMTLR